MNLYLDSGYVDIAKIINTSATFIFCVGGRGTGKTYGALDYVTKNDIKFILMRRRQDILDNINVPDFSPFKSLNIDRVMQIGSDKISKYSAAFYKQKYNDEKDEWENYGAPVGYTMALSTVSHLRGFDASDVDLLIYDEFIPEKHERAIKNEGEAFANAYETINRNRELKGKKPLKVLFLANANDINNQIFIFFRLVDPVYKAIKKGKNFVFDTKKGYAIFLLKDSPISEKKQKTALYKLTSGTEFSSMSIENDFNAEDDELIKSMKLNEYRLLVCVGELSIYQHKSNQSWYCSTHRSGTPDLDFTDQENDILRFRSKYMILWAKFLKKKIVFEDAYSKALFESLFKK